MIFFQCVPFFNIFRWSQPLSMKLYHIFFFSFHSSVRDSVVQECVQFLEQCETYGKNVKTVIEQPLEEVQLHRGKNTVTYEARLLKALLLQLEME